MLYILSTIMFITDWAFVCHAFIKHSYNVSTMLSALMDNGPQWRSHALIDGITGSTSTLLVDITIIWCCWMFYDCQWQIVLLPITCAIAATVMKIMQIHNDFLHSTDNISNIKVFGPNINWSLIYALLSLATNLTCTLLIVYKIIHSAPRLFLFQIQRIISALIESSMIYTLALIMYLALAGRNMMAGGYTEIIAVYMRNIAPTFLVLHVETSPTSSSGDEESTDSRPLSDITFQPMGENSTGSDNSSDQSFSESHRIGTIESV
ncbi:hypothetical protein IW261DRAFT_1424204 [Armillaria novae-zelandiae]|uniref:Uncharacterized protein n=1 Tax=Armillaria novae-zelandiae TaxID=153914 RepID=A0AA39NVG4_9AGAR|nr:hypothetical protein IW261DRAFT_1424204 [Armillaria novae-zelandiae]